MRLDTIKTGNQACVVFVHGILSSGEACWTNRNTAFWPKLLADEDAAHALSVYSFTYQSNVFSGSYNLDDAVDALAEEIKLGRLLESGRIIFVCHSMGGIVARRYLVRHAIHLFEQKIAVGLFLVASPSLGADLANFLEPLAKLLGHTQGDALRFSQNNLWLNALDKDFVNLKESRKLALEGRELIEDKFLILKKFFFLQQIVSPFAGARYFDNSFKVSGSDHSSIAKPAGKEDIQHRILRDFVNQQVPRARLGENVKSATPAKPLNTKKIFVSYRHADPDQALANAIASALEASGHTVFIDRKIKTGQRWADEISKAIENSSCLVLLLSAESVLSEMVRGEYGLALKHKLRILPVRVAYTSRLPSDIAALDAIQYSLWQAGESHARVVSELLDAINAGAELPQSASHEASAQGAIPESAPLPAVDTHAYAPESPGGTMPADSPYYVVRDGDSTLAAQIRAGRSTTLIKGVRQSGKSSLLMRGMALARERGCQTFYLDFQSVAQQQSKAMDTLDSLLQEFGRRLQRTFQLQKSLRERWDDRLGIANLTEYIEDELARPSRGNIVLFLDEVDIVFGKDYRKDFFAMLRNWHNNRAAFPDTWGKVSLVIAHATDAAMWITQRDQSPFNVGTTVEVKDFSTEQVALLNERYQRPLHMPEDIAQLMGLVGGHPYLLRRALHAIGNKQLILKELLDSALAVHGPFSDHLKFMTLGINADAGVKTALQEILTSRKCSDSMVFERMAAAGWVDGTAQAARFKRGLYEQHVRSLLFSA